MSAFTGAVANVPQGVAGEGRVNAVHTVGQSTTSSDTLALSKVPSMDADLLPIDIFAWRPSTGAYIRNMAMTTFNKTTGVLTITPSTTLAVGDLLIVTYMNMGVL